MEGESIEFDQVLDLLPEGWEAKAKELGALRRAREITTARELLRLILLYLTEGASFAGTSVLVQLTGQAHLNKNATYKRIRNSAEWLQWLAVNLLRQGGLLVAKPAWLGNRTICLVDGSEVVYGGPAKIQSMLHYCVDAFTLAMQALQLTERGGGEKLSRFEQFGPHAVVVADRVYGTLPGMEHLRERGSGFVLRLRAKAFKVYNRAGQEIELLKGFKGLQAGENGSVAVYYRTPEGDMPVRICALRKDQKSEQAGLERLKKINQHKRHGRPISALQRAYNKYLLVATSLDETISAKQVLETYRIRWQIELVFKRLKSLFHYNEAPVKLEQSARAWFYGKLLLAALCEVLVNRGRFSPGRARADRDGTAESVEGTENYSDVGDPSHT